MRKSVKTYQRTILLVKLFIAYLIISMSLKIENFWPSNVGQTVAASLWGFFWGEGWGVIVGLHTSPPLKLTLSHEDHLPHVLIEGPQKTACKPLLFGRRSLRLGLLVWAAFFEGKKNNFDWTLVRHGLGPILK